MPSVAEYFRAEYLRGEKTLFFPSSSSYRPRCSSLTVGPISCQIQLARFLRPVRRSPYSSRVPIGMGHRHPVSQGCNPEACVFSRREKGENEIKRKRRMDGDASLQLERWIMYQKGNDVDTTSMCSKRVSPAAVTQALSKYTTNYGTRCIRLRVWYEFGMPCQSRGCAPKRAPSPRHTSNHLMDRTKG